MQQQQDRDGRWQSHYANLRSSLTIQRRTGLRGNSRSFPSSRTHAKWGGKLAASQARPPAIDVEVLEIHVQGETTVVPRTPNFSIDCDIFLRVKLTLREMRPIEILEYELSAAFRGNSLHADFLDDVPNWGLVTERQPIGIGTTFRYIVSKLPPLVRKLDSAGVPVEGWLHFQVNGVPEKDIGAAIHRLNVVTPTGAVSTDIRDLAGVESGEFHRLPYASCAKGLVSK